MKADEMKREIQRQIDVLREELTGLSAKIHGNPEPEPVPVPEQGYGKIHIVRGLIRFLLNGPRASGCQLVIPCECEKINALLISNKE